MRFDDGFEQTTILRTGPDGLTRVLVRTSWAERESLLVDAREAELVLFRRWVEFHRGWIAFRPSWEASIQLGRSWPLSAQGAEAHRPFLADAEIDFDREAHISAW